MPILLEIVCGSPEDAAIASASGADRIELCSATFLGGLTPTLGALSAARGRTALPIMAMLRSRAGDFAYSDAEFEAMRYDATLLISHGALGIVFGFLLSDGTIDIERTRSIGDLVQAAGVESVFHRAFDLASDPLRALDQLMELGITRVLTSGGQRTALEGASVIQQIASARARTHRGPARGRHTPSQSSGDTRCHRLRSGASERLCCAR